MINEFKTLIAPCSCSCSMLRIDIDKDDNPEYNTYIISHYTSSFYIETSVLKTFWNRVRSAWKMLTGQEYHLYDLVLYKKDWDKFVEFVNESNK